MCKIKFTGNAGLNKKIIVILFLTKVFAGIFNGWLSHYYPHADTWLYHNEALTEYHLLFKDPKEYFTNLFISNYGDNYSGLFKSTHSYWNDLKTNLMVKFISVMDIFSGGNYYINVILYNFICFFGNMALFKVFSSIYKGQHKILAAGCFLLPSFLYFGSSIHKEGLIIACLGIVIYGMYTGLRARYFKIKKLIYISAALIFIFLLRNYIFIALLPPLLAWIICARSRFHPLFVFLAVYIIGVMIFFSISKLTPQLNLPAAIVDKQQAFLALEKANSGITLKPLTADFLSFLSNAPEALINSLFRPFITDGQMLKFLYPLGLEILIYELIFLMFLFYRKSKTESVHPFIYFGIFFSFSMLLIIGYITPVLGAIVRYRSIYLPFLIIPMICSIKIPDFVGSKQIKK